jgi:hypothetical protein
VEADPGGAEPLALQRLPGPVRIDGRPDEVAWEAVTPLPLTMYAPTYRGRPSQRTVIRVAYDDEALYAAGWFYDERPEGIRVNSLYRDRWNGDDAFAIYIDAFNDNQNAKWFGTTPAGIRFDLLVTDDGKALNESWDTFWSTEATVTSEGWFSEIRIPFSSLGFQVDERGRASMGLTVTRLISRTEERVTFPAIDPRFLFRQPSVARDVVLQDVRSARPLHVTPYVLGGVDRRVQGLQSPTLETERQTAREMGLDLRYALSGNLTLDVTANTDFAQVEADDEQVNLDRFDLFFPEKRRFFQEGSGVFDFVMGGGSRLFHSRRIGLNQDREPVPVLGGARLVGRTGEWDVGALTMQTEAQGDLPSENFGVARLRRRVLNPFSWAGVMATSRLSEGRYDLSFGADGFLRLFGDDYLTVRWASTFDDTEAGDGEGESGGDPGLLDRSRVYARWERRTGDGLAYQVAYTHSGPAFRPAVGFLPRSDVTRANLLLNWYRFMDEGSRFRRVWPGMLAFSTFRNGDGSLESGQYAVWVQWETKGGSGGWIEPKLFVEDVLEPFPIGGEVEIPAGTHYFADLQVALSMSSGRKLRTDLDARAGTFFDGRRAQVILSPTWNVSSHLEVGGEYQYTHLRFDDRDQGADIHLGRLRVRTALDAHASGNVFLQYNSTSDRLDLNLRLRYNFAEGTDLWLVWDEGLSTDRLRDPTGPRLPLSMSRTFLIKYTYTFGV